MMLLGTLCLALLPCLAQGTAETNDIVANLLQRLQQMEQELEHLRKMEARIDALEARFCEEVCSEKVRDIEEEVKQNTEDIVALRITDGHHDTLLAEDMAMINNINNSVIPAAINDVTTAVDLKLDFIDVTRPPIGSIVAWLPNLSAAGNIPIGWQRCDGSAIAAGPMTGMLTPDLNTARRFTRGGSDDTAGNVEEDSVEDHLHADPGHTHVDQGHTHADAGHSHRNTDTGQTPFCTGTEGYHAGRLGTSGNYYYFTNAYQSGAAVANIQASAASIAASITNMGGMSSGKMGVETRPKNMNVVYIIRIL